MSAATQEKMKNEAFHKFTRLGKAHAILGVISTAFGLAATIIYVAFPNHDVMALATGIWAGIFFVSVGGFVICTRKEQNSCSFFIEAICVFLCIAAALALIGIEFIAAVKTYSVISNRTLLGNIGNDYNSLLATTISLIVLHGLQSVTGLIEAVVSMIHFSFCLFETWAQP